jgi:hypothetical protein
MCRLTLLVRGSNKVQQGSPVHPGNLEPALIKGQVLLMLFRQYDLRSLPCSLSGLRYDRGRVSIWEAFAKDRTNLPHARLLREDEGFRF